MPNRTQPSRYQASILAAGLALAGALLAHDKIGFLVRAALNAQVLLPAVGILMITVGTCRLLVEWPERRSNRSERRTRLGSEGGAK